MSVFTKVCTSLKDDCRKTVPGRSVGQKLLWLRQQSSTMCPDTLNPKWTAFKQKIQICADSLHQLSIIRTKVLLKNFGRGKKKCEDCFTDFSMTLKPDVSSCLPASTHRRQNTAVYKCADLEGAAQIEADILQRLNKSCSVALHRVDTTPARLDMYSNTMEPAGGDSVTVDSGTFSSGSTISGSESNNSCDCETDAESREEFMKDIGMKNFYDWDVDYAENDVDDRDSDILSFTSDVCGITLSPPPLSPLPTLDTDPESDQEDSACPERAESPAASSCCSVSQEPDHIQESETIVQCESPVNMDDDDEMNLSLFLDVDSSEEDTESYVSDQCATLLEMLPDLPEAESQVDSWKCDNINDGSPPSESCVGLIDADTMEANISLIDHDYVGLPRIIDAVQCSEIQEPICSDTDGTLIPREHIVKETTSGALCPVPETQDVTIISAHSTDDMPVFVDDINNNIKILPISSEVGLTEMVTSEPQSSALVLPELAPSLMIPPKPTFLGMAPSEPTLSEFVLSELAPSGMVLVELNTSEMVPTDPILSALVASELTPLEDFVPLNEDTIDPPRPESVLSVASSTTISLPPSPEVPRSPSPPPAPEVTASDYPASLVSASSNLTPGPVLSTEEASELTPLEEDVNIITTCLTHISLDEDTTEPPRPDSTLSMASSMMNSMPSTQVILKSPAPEVTASGIPASPVSASINLTPGISLSQGMQTPQHTVYHHPTQPSPDSTNTEVLQSPAAATDTSSPWSSIPPGMLSLQMPSPRVTVHYYPSENKRSFLREMLDEEPEPPRKKKKTSLLIEELEKELPEHSQNPIILSIDSPPTVKKRGINYLYACPECTNIYRSLENLGIHIQAEKRILIALCGQGDGHLFDRKERTSVLPSHDRWQCKFCSFETCVDGLIHHHVIKKHSQLAGLMSIFKQ